MMIMVVKLIMTIFIKVQVGFNQIKILAIKVSIIKKFLIRNRILKKDLKLRMMKKNCKNYIFNKENHSKIY